MKVKFEHGVEIPSIAQCTVLPKGEGDAFWGPPSAPEAVWNGETLYILGTNVGYEAIGKYVSEVFEMLND